MLDLESNLKKMNITIFPAKHGASVARELPIPTTDEIWDLWERIVWFPITHSDILRIGKDRSTDNKLEHTTWGLGNKASDTLFGFSTTLCLRQLL